MKFIDEAVITVRSGNGGPGCVSFRRERFVPRGGPDGGDGGKGGDVVFEVSLRKRTLSQFRYKRNFLAKNGAPGLGKNKTGENAGDIVIEVPPGTLIGNADEDEWIKDLKTPGERFIVAYGGRGGRGNRRFKSSTNRAPRFAQPGEPGQTLNLKIELKLLADVGIIGFPNAGKSTLIGAMSSARPKTGGYPFTTLAPNLGVVQAEWGEPFVAADMPGLIEGAHRGAGLGIQFLRHIERTRILVHLVDASAIDSKSPRKSHDAICDELSKYSASLPLKKQLIVLNKMDAPGAMENAKIFKSAVKKKTLMISAITGKGVKKLIAELATLLDAPDDPKRHESYPDEPETNEPT